MATEVIDNAAESRFELTIDGERVGLIDYLLRPGVIHLVHTEIEPARQEHGLASGFVQEVLDGLRATELRLQPDCPYVAHWLTKHPDYQDLTQR
jgi:uncharacterized protein